MGQGDFVWWIGIVEDINDPLSLGRARVRIFGYHKEFQTKNYGTNLSPTSIAALPWAITVMPANLPDVYGTPKLGDWVLGFFLDGKEAQEPAILGYIPGMASQSPFGQNKSTYKNFAKETTGTLRHQSGTYLQLTDTDIIVSSPRWGTWPLLDQLDWITNGYVDPHGRNIGRRPPPPPPPPPPGRRRRRGCFIPHTMISMADGTQKKIIDVQVGDLVYNRNKTKVNKVRFVEIVDGERHENLYCPHKVNPLENECFATIDHPIYLMNSLFAVYPKLTEHLYPWLGQMGTVYQPTIAKNTYNKVYNLWVDGDGTYIVNGYGTTSIIYDGGMLSDFYDKKYFSEDEIRKLYNDYTSNGNTLVHGAFALNYLIGKYDIKILREIFAYGVKSKMNSFKRRVLVTYPMLIVGFLLDVTSKLHKWRFVK